MSSSSPSSSPSPVTQRNGIKLLLHCPDGTFPYLTPALLEQCFPHDVVFDELYLGIAINDTCLVPIYPSCTVEKENNDQNDTDDDYETKQSTLVMTIEEKRQEKKLEKQRMNKRKRQRKLTEYNKPIGYEFTSNIKIDSWIVPYRRITVPSFDLISDSLSRSSSSGTTTTPPSDQHLYLWTSNGRHPITTEQYLSVTTGLQSNITIPLYDEVFIPSIESSTDGIDDVNDTSTNGTGTRQHGKSQRMLQKRIDQTVQNNQLWVQRHLMLLDKATSTTQECTSTPVKPHSYLSAKQDNESKDDIWIPIALTNHTTASTTGTLDDYLEWIRQLGIQQDLQQNIHRVCGCAVFGWQHVIDSNKRKQYLQTILNGVMDIYSQSRTDYINNSDKTEYSGCHRPSTVAIMSVSSLEQLLQILSTFNSTDNQQKDIDIVIGTNLPIKWAREKKAFVCNISDQFNRTLSSSVAEGSTAATIPIDQLIELDADSCIDLAKYAKQMDDDPSKFLWFNDPRPIIEGCTCLTCQTHSRSYLYHLICAQELLGEILLFIHNLHHLLQLFRTANQILYNSSTGSSNTNNN